MKKLYQRYLIPISIFDTSAVIAMELITKGVSYFLYESSQRKLADEIISAFSKNNIFCFDNKSNKIILVDPEFNPTVV